MQIILDLRIDDYRDDSCCNLTAPPRQRTIGIQISSKLGKIARNLKDKLKGWSRNFQRENQTKIKIHLQSEIGAF
jgi:hypothetical protein